MPSASTLPVKAKASLGLVTVGLVAAGLIGGGRLLSALPTLLSCPRWQTAR